MLSSGGFVLLLIVGVVLGYLGVMLGPAAIYRLTRQSSASCASVQSGMTLKEALAHIDRSTPVNGISRTRTGVRVAMKQCECLIDVDQLNSRVIASRCSE